MVKLSYIQRTISLAILLIVCEQIWAQPAPYPAYSSVAGVSAEIQATMAARWLHLTANHFNDIAIPKSFDASNYWNYLVTYNSDYQTYRQLYDNGGCKVLADHTNDATIERAMQYQGLDIYDGAVWQIALSLAAIKESSLQYMQDVEGYQNFLLHGLKDGFLTYHAYSDYTYNGKLMSEENAYLFKFISPSWANNYDAVNDCNMQWPEWSAVTGEEAWAVFIGPVQSIYVLNDGAHNPDWSTASQAADYIQLGKNALAAISAMQAPSGGVYRNVALPEQSQNLDISLENNFSLYAGLSMLEQALKARDNHYHAQLKVLKLGYQKSMITKKIQLQRTLNSDEDDIQTINKIKKGMVQFFSGQGGVDVFDSKNQYFYASVNNITPDTKNFAVDVQTWGATVIASIKKDQNDPNDPDLQTAMIQAYGKDAMFNMLQATIVQSGYYDSNQNLLGVGYTAQKPTDDFYELSGEWTFGAINAAIVLADYYQNDSDKSVILISQAKKMLDGVAKEASNLQGSADGSTSRVSYLYANKRIFIPFGWFSNKVPATASTAWSLMVNRCFNPLELGGGNYQAICQQLKLGY